MRNLKRALSVALASVMLLGMMVVGTGASYADVKADHNQEAIEVMKLLGIMTGDEKGNFNPDQKVTRNEMAVIMVNLMDLNTKDYKGTCPFTDVPAWAQDYVAACYANKIVSGTSDTTYGGDQTVTTAQAALMMMKALGYFQYSSDFGDDWMVATVKQASKISLFKGLSSSANAELTRNDVAQLALNALKADVVEAYGQDGIKVEAGDTTVTVGSTITYYAELNDDDFDYRENDFDSELQLVEKLFGEDVKMDDEARDDFGRPATKWINDDTEKEVVVADKADLVVIVAKTDKDLADIVEDKELTVNDEAKMAVQGGTDENYDEAQAVAAGTVIEFFKTKKEVTKVVVYHYDIAVVTDVEVYDEEDEMVEDYGASKGYTLNTVAEDDPYTDLTYVDTLSEDKDGYQAIGSYKEDDVLAIVIKEDGEILSSELAKSVNGKMAAKGNSYIKVDGTKYTIVAGVTPANYSDSFTYYLDPNGVIVDKETYEEAEDAREYVYVIKTDATDAESNLLNTDEDKAVVKVMHTDGTVEVVDYDLSKATTKNYAVKDKDNADKTIDKGDLYFTFKGTKYEFNAETFKAVVKDDTWYAFTTSSKTITLKDAEKEDVSALKTVEIEKDARTLATGLYATSSTKVVVFDEDGILKTYTGYSKFPSDKLEAEDALVIYGSNSKYASTVYIYDESAEADTSKIDVALYVSKGDVTEDGTVVTFYVDGEKVSYTVASGLAETPKAGQLYEISLNEDDIATVVQIATATVKKGTIDVVSDDYIALTDNTEIELAKDCAVYQVSLNRKTVSKGALAEDQKVVVFQNDDGAYLIFIYKENLDNIVVAD